MTIALRSRLCAIALSVTMIGSACVGGGPGDVSSLAVSALTGSAMWRPTAAESWRPAGTGTKLRPGATLRVVPGAAVTLNRGRASQLELRPYDAITPAELQVQSPDRVSIGSGDVLVVNGREAPITVESQGVTAAGEEGTFRFDRRLSVRVGVYEGSAVVSSPAGQLNIPRLREAGLLRRQLPRAPRPLTVRPTDPWDARLLADVIDLDRELAAQRRGAEGEFRRLDAERLEAVAGSTDVSFVDDPRYASIPSGDKLVGVVLGLVVEQSNQGTAADVFARAIDLLGAGASWGLIAREFAASDRLLEAVVQAVGLLTGEVRPSARRRLGSRPPTTEPPRSSPTPQPTDEPTPKPSPSKTRKPKPSPSPSPSPSPTPTPCNPVDFLLGNCQEPDV